MPRKRSKGLDATIERIKKNPGGGGLLSTAPAPDIRFYDKNPLVADWTRDLPTMTGWYWHRLDGDFTNRPNIIMPIALFVSIRENQFGKSMSVLNSIVPVGWGAVPAGGWWSGPIVAPEVKDG